MLSILNGIQGLVNLLFFVAIVWDFGGLVDICQSIAETVWCRLSVEQNSPYRWD